MAWCSTYKRLTQLGYPYTDLYARGREAYFAF